MKEVRSTSSRIHAADIAHLVLAPGLGRSILYASEPQLLDGDEFPDLEDDAPVEEEADHREYHPQESDADIFHLSTDKLSTPQLPSDLPLDTIASNITCSIECSFNAESEALTFFGFFIDSGATRTVC